jgi:hypothetical protein
LETDFPGQREKIYGKRAERIGSGCALAVTGFTGGGNPAGTIFIYRTAVIISCAAAWRKFSRRAAKARKRPGIIQFILSKTIPTRRDVACHRWSACPLQTKPYPFRSPSGFA